MYLTCKVWITNEFKVILFIKFYPELTQTKCLNKKFNMHWFALFLLPFYCKRHGL